MSILLFTFHVSQDIVRGFDKGTMINLPVFPIVVLWLWGTLVLAERRSGLIIILIFSFLGMGVPVIHMMGKGVGIASRLSKYPGHFFYVWTLIAFGATTLFTVLLSVRALWSSRRGEVS